MGFESFIAKNTFLLAEDVVINTDKIIHNPKFLLIGVGLIILAVIIIFILKNIILNSIVGVVAFLVCNFIFGIKLPFFLTIVASAIFGLFGVGIMLVLRYLGIV
jgi:hypothetical protein